MKPKEVHDIARYGIYEGTVLNGKVEETHISWVILTRKHAIKIKKPVQLAFLDFSTLHLRKQFCEKELHLNSRFSDIYQAVLPIRFVSGKWMIGGEGDSGIVEYCVVMRRMAVSKRLDNVLRKGNPGEGLIRSLATEIACFHIKLKKILSLLK